MSRFCWNASDEALNFSAFQYIEKMMEYEKQIIIIILVWKAVSISVELVVLVVFLPKHPFLSQSLWEHKQNEDCVHVRSLQ